MNYSIFFVFLAVFFGFIIVYLSLIFRKTSKELNVIKLQKDELFIQNSILNAKLEANENASQKLQKDLELQNRNLEHRLNELLQNHFDKKLEKFDETSLKSIATLLNPFAQNLNAFQKQIEASQENNTKKFAELSKEIEFLAKAGMSITAEAQNLTQALKGKKQTQGSWGEMILESVLEYSGLQKGLHYETQENFKDDQNRFKRPDVVVKLPQNKSIIIDSKVSLNDYDDFIKSDNEDDRVLCGKRVALAFKNHIDTLDSKEYSKLKIGTLQYVFMFVPIEGAFAVATQHDSRLYEYALKKNIVIANPSTLTVTLRTIYLYWQSEQSNTNAVKLFEEAGKLYDKMVIFSDNFVKIGSTISSLQGAFDNAEKQLKDGSGNILTRFENIKKLGARAMKSLKDSKIDLD